MKVFDSVPVQKPNKNVFNLSHDVKGSYGFDYLYPILCQPVYPGETWNCRMEVFMRAMPLLAPVMHNVDLHAYFAFIPDRLIFNEDKKHNFKVFITGGEDGLQTAALPTWSYNELYHEDPFDDHRCIKSRSLIDHLGFPSFDADNMAPIGGNERISALPLRAYQLFWNEYVRNQNVQNEVEFSYGQGNIPVDDYTTLFKLRKKCWEKDYFTSALPFQQRGEAVLLPVSGNIQASGILPVYVSTGRPLGSETAYGIKGLGDGAIGLDGSATTNTVTLEGTASVTSGSLSFTGLSVGTINDFRACLRLQQWLENNARCGSRYIEQLFSHFGVVSSDARLQRPELLGGGKIPLLFTDVEQTSYGQGHQDDVLGDLGGKGTLYGKTSGFKKYFEEHGILLGMICIVPRTSYSQGIPRHWTLLDKTDWYFPEFAHLGEQAILNKEIYYDLTHQAEEGKGPDDVFGYQGRFTELRYIPSSVHGEMRTDLQYWHFGRLFSSLPALNSEFVEANTRANVWAMADLQSGEYDPFVAQFHLDIKAVRPMPKYAVPTL